MLFHSLDFALFLPIVFGLYWLAGQANSDRVLGQNTVLLVASYIFYGAWDWRFLLLIAFSTIVDFAIALHLEKENAKAKRKVLLGISLVANLGLLFVFKYFNFFLDNFVTVFTWFGHDFQVDRLQWILPVGISFYTFQTLSYTIDVYRKTLHPTRDFVAFATYVSFFPQLVAGPIERASNFLPQILAPRVFSEKKASDGLRHMLWGLFKKMVIADNCALVVDSIFSNADTLNGSTLFLGALLFSFQIYCDFSGYSDIAIGTARLFGLSLMQNFAFPYFARDVAEFWRRWHISLTTWFRDYVYIPLGGSRGGKWLTLRNVWVVFLISGFWHGAKWTFVLWGAVHALLFTPLFWKNKNRQNLKIVAKNRFLPTFRAFFQMLSTFLFVTLAWILFRADSVEVALNFYGNIFSMSLLQTPILTLAKPALVSVFFIVFLMVLEWQGREMQHPLELFLLDKKHWWRWSFYAFLALCIGIFSPVEQSPFIYFQF